MAIAEMVTRATSMDRIEEELKKTQVLCSNYHRLISRGP